jgi:hypothetical protein
MPARKANESGFKAPPPPPELVDAGLPPELAAAWFSVTLADALPDSPLVVELQVIPKISVTDEVSRANGSVTVWLPLVAFVPAQLSSGPPPVAVQLVALDDFHVSVVDFPAVMVVGDADSAAVTVGQLHTTDADTLTAATPGAVQLSV